jgi:choline-sulfatase
MKACDHTAFDITPDQIRRARRGYFANISYVDEKIGEILDTLERGRMADNTIILFVSDHGDMLGERGLWFKMNFFEGSARVPLMIAAPDWQPKLIDQPVSTLDVTPTLAALAGIDIASLRRWTDGEDLTPLARGTGSRSPVPMEYAAEGSEAPFVGLRDGNYKLTLCEKDPPMLFDLREDPKELTNLAGNPAYAETLERLTDLSSFDAAVRESQARRWVVYTALRNGAYYPWDYQPLQKASERYMRNHMDLNVLEENQRYPRGE